MKQTTTRTRNDLQQIQGTWHMVAIEVNGATMPIAASEAPRIVIDGDRFTSLGMGAVYGGTVALDGTKSPKTFDLVITQGPAAGTRNPGIYTLDADRWTICLATRGSKRPRTFSTKPDTGLALETFARKAPARATVDRSPKSTPRPRPTATARQADRTPATGRVTALEGEWAMTAGIFNGAAMAKDMIAWVRRVTDGSTTTVLAGPQVMLKARFTVDDPAQPRTINYVNLEGTHKGKSQAGIVELKGDVLRICMAPPGKPRPGDFSSTSGDRRSYTTWRRGHRGHGLNGAAPKEGFRGNG